MLLSDVGPSMGTAVPKAVPSPGRLAPRMARLAGTLSEWKATAATPAPPTSTVGAP